MITVYHKHQYNDANYLVLAKVIENVTGNHMLKIIMND